MSRSIRWQFRHHTRLSCYTITVYVDGLVRVTDSYGVLVHAATVAGEIDGIGQGGGLDARGRELCDAARQGIDVLRLRTGLTWSVIA